MANTRYRKNHQYNASPNAAVAPVAGGGVGTGAYGFDSLGVCSAIYWPTAIVASSANTTVLDVFTFPQRCVLVKYAICYNTGAAYQSGTDKWNLIMGGGAEVGTTPAAQVLATNGQGIFAADKAFAASGVANYNVDTGAADVPEGYYDAGTVLSLRVVTGATVGTHLAVTSGFAIQVYLLLAPVDAFPSKTATANPATPDF